MRAGSRDGRQDGTLRGLQARPVLPDDEFSAARHVVREPFGTDGNGLHQPEGFQVTMPAPLTSAALACWAIEQVHEMTPAARAEIAERHAADNDDAEVRLIKAKIDAIKAEVQAAEMQRAKTRATSKPKTAEPKSRPVRTEQRKYRTLRELLADNPEVRRNVATLSPAELRSATWSDSPFVEGTPDYIDWCTDLYNARLEIR